MNTIDQFRDAIRSAGYEPPADIIPGKFHRFSANGKRSDTAGFCKMFDDAQGGIFGDFRNGVTHEWQIQRKHELSPAERQEWHRKIEQAKAEREAEAERLRQAAQAKAQHIWDSSPPADDSHPYLVRKGVKAHNLRQSGDAIVVPIKDTNGTLYSLQFIDPEGNKRFLTGGRIRGCYSGIGKPTDRIVVAEGYATAASIHESTGHAVAIAFNAGNLEPVCLELRKRFPDLQMIVSADNDVNTPGNPGMTKATKAANQVGAVVVAPEAGDFNDLALSAGPEAVADAFIDHRPPEPIDLFAEFPVPPLQPDMLPKTIADYAFDSGEMIGVDPAMIAIPALVACAAALHDDVRLQPKRYETGWTESARLWCAVVGSPSVKKSPAIRRATKRLRKIDMDLHDDNAKAMAQYQAQLEEYKDAKKEAKKTGEHVTPPEQPQNTRMVVEDITVEALSEVLKTNSRGVLCIQDELSGWFGAMDAYSGGKTVGKDRAHWLEAYNGGGRVVDRVMRGTLKIPNWSVSMIGGIQPDAIRRIANNMTDDGLMQRFMIIVGGNMPEQDRPEDAKASRAFSELIDHLYAVTAGSNPVTLTEDAHQVREALNHYTAEMIDYPALPGGLKSHLGKWSGLFARLLLIFHAIECAARQVHPSAAQVTGDTAHQVDRLMRNYLLPHALAYYTDILGAAGDLEHARWIAGHILSKRLQTVTLREILQAYKQWRGLDEWRRVRIMQMLEDMGWVVPLEGDRPSRRGANTWSVNMMVHSVFAEKARHEAESRDRVRDQLKALQHTTRTT